MSREGRFCLTHIAELEAMSRWGNPDVPTFKNDWYMSQSEPSPITHLVAHKKILYAAHAF